MLQQVVSEETLLRAFTVVEPLKVGVVRKNSYICDMPVAGHHIVVFRILSQIFIDKETVFVFLLDEMKTFFTQHCGVKEKVFTEGLEDLKYYGYIKKSEGVVTPTERFVSHFKNHELI